MNRPAAEPQPRYKIPISVLVVVHTPALDVLLLERADWPGFWQSVTGSIEHEGESLRETAVREVREETGIDATLYRLADWQRQNQFEIFKKRRRRYAPGITHNLEHVFGLTVPERLEFPSRRRSTRPTSGCRGARLRRRVCRGAIVTRSCCCPKGRQRTTERPPICGNPRRNTGRATACQNTVAVGDIRSVSLKEPSSFEALDTSRRDLQHPQGLFAFQPPHDGARAARSSAPAQRGHRVPAGGAGRARAPRAQRFEDWPAEPQYEFLADSVWKDYAYGRNAIYDHGHHGNAILSRYPIITAENEDVSAHAFERRGLLHCEIGMPGAAQPLHCVCVHLALNERGRRRQIGALIERMRRLVPDGAPAGRRRRLQRLAQSWRATALPTRLA